ncbi:MAG: alpha/beta hydrolase [Ruminococcus sp.]|nr:alpha/beta hydrolase [Ruminococcus sp.]
MSIEIFQNDIFSMRYLRFGKTDGKPFVIIPGLALKSVIDSAVLIEAQYKSIADEYDVYVFDRRTEIPEVYNISDMADDTATALDALTIRNAAVYGVSQGGMIAQEIAIKHPCLVGKLILCSTAAYIPDTAADILDSWAKLAVNKNRTELIMSFAENIYTSAYCEKYKDVFVKFAGCVTDDELQRFVIMANGCKDFDVRNRLGSITAPVLVIGAEQDKLFGSATSKELAELTNGQIMIYPDEAHSVYDENADVIVQIKSFLV